MKKERKNKGITLIALIITIIVMLILVGVTVNVALNGGLFDTAKQATERTETAMIQEELSVIEVAMNADILANTEKYTVINDESELASLIVTISGEIQKYFVVDSNYIEGGVLKVQEMEEAGLLVPVDTNKGNLIVPCKYKDSYDGKVIVEVVITEEIKIESFELDFNFPVYFDKSLLTAEDLAVYESLCSEEKKTYEGIFLGAHAFTNDVEFAGMLASNDFNETTETNTFFFNGYAYTTFRGLNLAALMFRPDGSIVELIGDSNPVTYYMDSQYNMYEFNSETNVLKDENGIILTTEDIRNGTLLSETEYNGYKYAIRFDNKNVLITDVPDQEVLDMRTDLTELNVYSMNPGMFKNNTSIKRIILPDTIQTLMYLALSRSDSDGAAGMFEDATSLEYVELSNDIQVLYTHAFENCTNLKEVIMPDNITTIEDGAFTGCDGVTLKFKDVNNIPEGQPWGGTNLNIVSK